MRVWFAIALCLSGLPLSAHAEFSKVVSKSQFMRLVADRTLTRPFVELQVTSDGQIQGRGLQWDVSGEWAWRDGFFCRSLFWGGDDLGYNCQEVRADGARLRFTSDQGTGRSAVFSLE